MKAKIRVMPLAKLKPAEWNPRTIKPENLKGLRASLERYGLVEPIIWNERSGRVVGGHQRIKALMTAGQTEAAVRVVDLGDEDEKLLNVTLNNRKVQGEFEEEKLADLLEHLSLNDHGGLEDLRLDALMKLLPELPVAKEDVDGGGEKFPRSDTRVVQLFLSPDQAEEFFGLGDVLARRFSTDNMSDTVVEAMNAARKAL